MNKTKISAKIVADSISPQGDRLISVLCTFPRIILSEVNTHRMLSKNTSSSRAIPFKKMVEAVENDPFIPIAWQKDHKGMQGSEYFTDEKEILSNEKMWLHARDYAIQSAEAANRNFGITKQLCNRLLEPFMWTTMLITGSKEGWDNFFNLRCPQYEFVYSQGVEGINYEEHPKYWKSKKEWLKFKSSIHNEAECYKSHPTPNTDIEWLQINKGQAEIHMMALAEEIYDAMNESTPKQLEAGEWHIPFGDNIHKVDTSVFANEDVVSSMFDLIRVKISTAMAARTSYTVVGDEKEIDYQKMIELHDRLLSQDPPHSSPLEHCARAMSDEEFISFFKGELPHENLELVYKGQHGWCNNLKGFIPYRYLIDNNLTF